MATIERAIVIAVTAHAGQTDKAGVPYIFHPLRIMLAMKTLAEKIAAVLHDVMEDSDWTVEGLRAEGFAEEIIEALVALKRADGESYKTYVLRAAKHPIARAVKLEDLHDNSDLSRIPHPTAEDIKRVAKYRRAIALIEAQAC